MSRRPTRDLARVTALAAWLALASFPAAADDLGRVFFTPQQRQELDRRRLSNVQESGAAVTVESTVTVNGHVARSSGRTTTWINGVPQYDSHRSHDPSRVVVGGNEGDPPVDVKIGQTLDKTRGEVKDGLDGGRITIRRGTQRPAGD